LWISIARRDVPLVEKDPEARIMQVLGQGANPIGVSMPVRDEKVPSVVTHEPLPVIFCRLRWASPEILKYGRLLGVSSRNFL
jgi:hypothetical protein